VLFDRKENAFSRVPVERALAPFSVWPEGRTAPPPDVR
jgi:hypothetical protein